MKTWMKARSIGWASGALVLVLLVVTSLTAASPKPMRAAGNGASLHGPAPLSEITPGTARAEMDTLDLQLD
jgi:hypothetical protein